MVLASMDEEGKTTVLEDGYEDLQSGTVGGAVEHAEEAAERGQWKPAGPLHRKLVFLPSKAEQERHRRCHIPFAPWCPDCVSGRKPNWGHYHVQLNDREKTCPEVHLDYCFFRNSPGGASAATLVLKDRTCRALAAHVVPWKGATVEWVVQQVKRDLAKWGIRDNQVLRLRSDNEPALADLLAKIAEARGEEARTVLEHSPPRDSAKNGFIEVGVKSIEGLVRTLWIAMLRALGTTVDIMHPIFSWLVEHAADLVTRLQVGSDGTTAWERLKGKKYRGEYFEFAQKVWHRIPDKPAGGLLKERWLPGIWLGRRWASDEHVIAMTNGLVVRAASVHSFPEEQKWSKEEVLAIRGVPWAPSGTLKYKDDVAIVPEPPKAPMEPLHPPAAIVPRGFRVTPEMFKDYGYSENCRKCSLMQSCQDDARARHTEACRDRIINRAKLDPKHRSRSQINAVI